MNIDFFQKLSTPPNNFEPGQKLVSFVNPYSYCVIRNLDLTQINEWYVDGVVAVKVFRLLGIDVRRASFDLTSLAPIVFKQAERSDLSVAILGAKPQEIINFEKFLIGKYPKLNLVYTRHGYFNNDAERVEAFESLCEVKPDIVVVGMGTPIQESTLIELREMGWSGTGFTCGGFIHQTASTGGDYYPSWINKMNLRWLYRMWDEPKLIKRYFKYYPLFLFYVLKDWMCFRKK